MGTNQQKDTGRLFQKVSRNNSPHDPTLLNRLAGYYRDLLFSLSAGTVAGKHLTDLAAVLRDKLTADLGLFVPDTEELLSGSTIRFQIERVARLFISRVVEQGGRSEEERESGESEPSEEAVDVGVLARDAASAVIVAIYRKQEFDPYNREVLIGFPLVSGTVNGRRYCAPLLYYKAGIDFEPLRNMVVLTKDLEIPALNFQLIRSIVESDDEIEVIRKQVLPYFYTEDFDSRTVADIVKTLAALVEALPGLRYDPSARSSLGEALKWRDQPVPRVFNASVVLSAPRSNAYLLDDLLELGRIEEEEGTAIDAILTDPPDIEGVEEQEDPAIAPAADPLLYPLVSNRAQRLAALKAENARLMVIQGPPGTGKSQTIVNLISHLVARGKTVLVSSHQNKALEVITKNLPRIDYLAMSLFRGEKQSLIELTNKIEALSSHVSDVNSGELERLLDHAMASLKEKDVQIKRLQTRFSELKMHERGLYPTFHSYRDLRPYDLIDPVDTVADGADQEVAESLGRYWAALARLDNNYRDLTTVLPEHDPSLSGGVEVEMQCDTCGALNKISKSLLSRPFQCGHCSCQMDPGAGNLQTAIANSRLMLAFSDHVYQAVLPDKITLEFCRPLTGVCEPSAALTFFASLNAWLETHGPGVISALGKLSGSHGITIGLRHVHKTFAAYGSRAAGIAALADALLEKVTLLSESAVSDGYPQYPNSEIMAQVKANLDVLEKAAGSLFSWKLKGSARRARSFFSLLGMPISEYKERLASIQRLRAWHRHWRLRHEVCVGLVELQEMGYPLAIKGSGYLSMAEIYRCVGVAEPYSRLARAALELPDIPANEVEGPLDTQLEGLTNLKALSTLKESLSTARAYFDLMGTFRDREKNKHFASCCRSAFASLVTLCCTLTESTDARRTSEWLRKISGLFDDYIMLKTMESTTLRTLPATLSLMRNEAAAGNADPGSKFREGAKIVQAFRLARLMGKDLLENPDDINQTAALISQLKKGSSDLILKILGVARRLALKKATDNPASMSQVNKLKQVLKKKRKTYSFMQLRQQIDYRRLLALFPCWVMSIDDVARIFPLEPGLFDYLVVDEASQCNQATVLHLAYRSRRMIVVGDEKQMKNPNTQFLSDVAVRLNLTKHKLDTHPNSVFLHGRNSLLDLATGCQDTSPVFLNEHFRSEPPIIDFCNHAFYNDRLRVMTPFRRRNFTPCMELRLVQGACDDPEDAKVNDLEARQVIVELKKMLGAGQLEGDSPGEKLSIGILSPFRKQALLLQNMVYEAFSENPQLIKEHQMTVSTVDGFQGDERDVILYSFRYASNSKPGVVNAIQKPGSDHDMGRLNVAFSRARRKVVCFVSVPKELFPKGIIREYLDHVAIAQTSVTNRIGDPNQRGKCQSDFERDVFDDLNRRGLTVYAQVPCAGFAIDFVVADGSGRRMAVECDGEFHYEPDGQLREEDYQRQDIIERYGWTVYRLASRRYYGNPGTSIDALIAALGTLEPDREIAGKTPPTTEKASIVELFPPVETVEEAPAPYVAQPQQESVDLEPLDPLVLKVRDILADEGEIPVHRIRTQAGHVTTEDIMVALEWLTEKGWVETFFKDGVKVWKLID